MKKTEKLPLKMGNRPIGYIVLDYDTGELSGQVEPEMVDILNQGLGMNMLQVSFYGRAGNPELVLMAQAKLSEFLSGTQEQVQEDELVKLIAKFWSEYTDDEAPLQQNTAVAKAFLQKYEVLPK